MVLWQSLDTPSCPVFMWVRGFECARAARSLCLRALFCVWSVVFGSRHSCLEFRFRVGVRTLALHVLSHCVSVRLEFARRALSCPRVFVCVCVCGVCTQSGFLSAACIHVMSLCCVARSSCISLAACFYVVMSCVNTQLMSVLISCVFHVLFCTWLVICFAGHVLVFSFVVSTWLLS